jgi:RHS repeat-associated protein
MIINYHSATRNNDVYAWNGHYNVDRPYTVNGLNQLTTAGSTALGYDGRGNLTSSAGTTYSYTSENRMVLAGTVYLSSGASGELVLIETGPTGNRVDHRFDHLGGQIVSEFDGSNVVTARYVYGPGADTPLVWYAGAGTSDRRWLIPDERGSIVAVTNASGAVTNVNRYDEYGIPAATNVGRFQYTGQAWLPEIGLYYYKARIYAPTLGRFMQTDPTGYDDGPNWYDYVGGDPVNNIDDQGENRRPILISPSSGGSAKSVSGCLDLAA